MIKSEEENQFVSDLLRNTSGTHSGWIGLYRKKADDKFHWLDDRPAEGNYQKWSHGEQNDVRGNEDCVELVRNSDGYLEKGKWNDKSCSNIDDVAICQWPI